jgi:alpha-tubulin suppressor-like RCC1 family protein
MRALLIHRHSAKRILAIAAVAAMVGATAGVATVSTAVGAPSAPSRGYKVTLNLARSTVPAGDKATLTGTVSPKATGKVTIQRLSKHGNWATLKKVTLSHSAYSTSLVFSSPASQILRVNKPKAGRVKAGHSDIATLTVAVAAWRQISAGKYFACGVKTDATAWCWGQDSSTTGDLGDGLGTSSDLPVQVGKSTNWRSISAGQQFACGVRTTGTLWCWGSDTSGELGDGGASGTFQLSPERIGTATNWASVSAATSGSGFACALKTTGTMWCWGDDGFGELGTGLTGVAHSSNVPVQVGHQAGWTAVSAGLYTACALAGNGTFWCWGDNRAGQLGNGTTGSATDTDTPGQVGTALWKSVGAGGFFTCGVQRAGTLWCWGSSEDDELGNGVTNSPDTDTPGQLGTATTWKSVTAGYDFGCGIQATHAAYCWGGDVYGQLGDGTMGVGVEENQPTPVDANDSWVGLSAGVDGICGTQTDQSGWCWGRDDFGEVGDGEDGAARDADNPAKLGGRHL